MCIYILSSHFYLFILLLLWWWFDSIGFTFSWMHTSITIHVIFFFFFFLNINRRKKKKKMRAARLLFIPAVASTASTSTTPQGGVFPSATNPKDSSSTTTLKRKSDPSNDSCASPDFVQSLLSYGRLVDMPIYEHFRSLADEDAGAAAACTFSHPSLSLAATCRDELKRVQNICALHLTQQGQWDGLLLQNSAMQERLTKLACLQFGLASMVSCVSRHQAGQREHQMGPGQPQAGGEKEYFSSSAASSPELIAVQIYTEWAMREGAQLVREMIVDESILSSAIPHRTSISAVVDAEEENNDDSSSSSSSSSSSTATTTREKRIVSEGGMIDYPYLQAFIHERIPSLFLQYSTRVTPPIEEQVRCSLLPLLSSSSSSFAGEGKGGNSGGLLGAFTNIPGGRRRSTTRSSSSSCTAFPSILSNLMGVTGGGRGRPSFRLHAVPLSLQHTAGELEQQLSSFFQWLTVQKPFLLSRSGEGKRSGRSSMAEAGRLGYSRLGMCVAETFSSISIFHRSSVAVVKGEEGQNGGPQQERSNVSSTTNLQKKEKGVGAGGGAATSSSHLDSLFAHAAAFFANQRIQGWMRQVELGENIVKNVLRSGDGKTSFSLAAGAGGSEMGSSPTEEMLSLDGSVTHPIMLGSFSKK